MWLMSFISAVLALTGASCPEELGEFELERFERLAEHPVELNSASRSRLLGSGLMSAYQVASLLDYRSRNGDILSYTELSLMDGFSPATAEALKLFTTLKSSAPPGRLRDTRTEHDLLLKASVREYGGTLAAGGVKYGLHLGDAAEFHWGSRVSYSERELTPGTASAAYYGRHRLGKVVAGDFCARFGQGLACWSGFSMSGFSSASAMSRSGAGLSPSSSFTRSLHGVGADFSLGKWALTAAWAWPGKRAATSPGWAKPAIINVCRTGRNASAGMTLAGNTISADWRVGRPAMSFFGEVGACGRTFVPAAVAGLMAVPQYGVKAAVVGRYYPADFKSSFGGPVRSSSRTSDEFGVATGMSSNSLNLTLDAAYRPSTEVQQYKAVFQLHPQYDLSENFTLKPSLRLAARLKPGEAVPLRREARLDLGAEHGKWNLSTRLDLVRFKDWAWLWYAEAGYRKSWVRWTLFRIDNWDDRIYCYERDAPGNFSSPAYYRRGWSLAAMLALKKTRRHAFYLRASVMGWPWTLEDAPPTKAEVKLQYQASLF